MNNNNSTSQQTRFGLLPSDWICLALGDLVHDVSYGSSSKSAKVGNVPVLRMGNMQDGFLDWNDLVYTSDESEINKYELKKNTVLFNRTNTVDLVGKAAIYRGERPAIYAGYLIKINNKPELLNAEYLNYILNTYQIKSYNKLVLSVAVSQANINGQKLKTYPIPVPPHIDEQTAIANALSDVDALLMELEKLIAKKQAIKTATMQQLLTGKTRLPQFATYTEGADKGKIKDTKTSGLGEIPEDWDVFPFSKIFNYQNGKAQEHLFNSNDGYKVISIGNYSESGKYIDTGSYIDKSHNNEIGRFVLKRDELAMILNDKTAIGTIIGRVILIDKNDTYVMNQRTMRLSPNEDFNSQYLFALINSEFVHKRIVGMAKPGTQIYINTDDVLEFQVQLPTSMEEQKAIAQIHYDMDNEIQTLEQRLSKTRQIKQGMMQQLLTGRTRLPFKSLETEQDGGS